MKNKMLVLSTVVASMALTACGSDDSDPKPTATPTPKATPAPEATLVPVVNTFGPLSTGAIDAPKSVYFDLETMQVVELTDADAATDNTWDIAFKRSDISLNNVNPQAPVSVYKTAVNSDFYNADGEPVADSFINANADTEQENFDGVTAADVPEDTTLFASDVTNKIISDFYHYNRETHQVTPAPDHFFIVSSDGIFSKFNVTAITTSGRDLSDFSLTVANQMASDDAFEAEATTIDVVTSEACAAYNGIYIDFAMAQTVSESDDWDLNIPCNADNSAGTFDVNVADDAQAMQDFTNRYDAIDAGSMRYYDFEDNVYTVKAFSLDDNAWYQYGLNGGHTLWSDFGVYLIKTETATYKLQILSYYDEEGNSGNFTFKAEALK